MEGTGEGYMNCWARAKAAFWAETGLRGLFMDALLDLSGAGVFTGISGAVQWKITDVFLARETEEQSALIFPILLSFASQDGPLSSPVSREKTFWENPNLLRPAAVRG